jgi:hypothetical protein
MSLTARIDAARHQATVFFRRHRNIQSAAIAAGGFVAVVYFLGAVTDFVAFEFRKSAAVEEPISQLIQALEAPEEAEAGTTAEIDNRWLFLTQPGVGVRSWTDRSGVRGLGRTIGSDLVLAMRPGRTHPGRRGRRVVSQAVIMRGPRSLGLSQPETI